VPFAFGGYFLGPLFVHVLAEDFREQLALGRVPALLSGFSIFLRIDCPPHRVGNLHSALSQSRPCCLPHGLGHVGAVVGEVPIFKRGGVVRVDMIAMQAPADDPARVDVGASAFALWNCRSRLVRFGWTARRGGIRGCLPCLQTAIPELIGRHDTPRPRKLWTRYHLATTVEPLSRRLFYWKLEDTPWEPNQPRAKTT